MHVTNLHSIILRCLSAIAVAGSSVVLSGSIRPIAADLVPPKNITLPDYWEKLLKPGRLKFIQTLPFAMAQGHEKTFSADMQSPACTSRVDITPTAKSLQINPAEVKNHPQGFVVAKITNTSKDCKVQKFGIDVLETVYWVVQYEFNDTGHTVLRSHFVNADRDAGNDAKATFRTTECNTQHPASSTDLAMISYKQAGCAKSLKDMLPPKAALMAAQSAGLTLLDGDITFWFACSQTCCFADG
jgi:hypothetical protein